MTIYNPSDSVPDVSGKDVARRWKAGAVPAGGSSVSPIDQTDRTMPNGPWEFDASVTAVFDDMLNRSIPELPVMRAAVNHWVVDYAQESSVILDLGCSRGGMLRSIYDEDRLPAELTFVGLDNSEPMIDAARAAFKSTSDVAFRKWDLTDGLPPVENVSVVLAVLTLQFIPIPERQRLVRQAFERLNHGGAMIVVEKVIGMTDELNRSMVHAYYDLKRKHGYTSKAIHTKAEALRNVLVPLTDRWNVEQLFDAGFRDVECFWRWMNFAGWVAVK